MMSTSRPAMSHGDERADCRPVRVPGCAVVLAAGVAVEAALLLGLVRPLWLFSHHDIIAAPEPLAAVLGARGRAFVAIATVFAVWCTGYAVAIVAATRSPGAGARRLLVSFPALFLLTLMFVLPVSSQDVYHYVMEGRVAAVHGGNPLIVPPAAYPDDALAGIIGAWGDTPSRYGPAFNLPATAVARLAGDHLVAAVLGFKLLAVAALAGTVALVWATVDNRPGRTLAITLIAWNPLALYEAGANAHNDLLMVFWTALALWSAVRRRWRWALPALAMGALTKYVAALLGPPFLLIAVHAHGRRAVRPLLVGAALAAALTLALYAPFWEGVRTFDALRSASGGTISSPGWLLRQALKPALGWNTAGAVARLALSAVFIAGYAVVLVMLHRASRAAARSAVRDVATDLRLPAGAALAVVALELCTLSWWLWPWYALWLLPPAALLAGAGGRRVPVLVAATCGAALFAYLPLNFREWLWGAPPTDRIPLTVVTLLFAPSLVAAAIWVVRLHRRGRRPPSCRETATARDVG